MCIYIRTLLPEEFHIRPVEARTSTREHAHRVRKQIDQLGVPVAHLAARAPEGAEDGGKVTPSPLAERGDEGGARALLGARPHDVEQGRELGVGLGIVPHGVADVQDDGLGTRGVDGHGQRRRSRVDLRVRVWPLRPPRGRRRRRDGLLPRCREGRHGRPRAWGRRRRRHGSVRGFGHVTAATQLVGLLGGEWLTQTYFLLSHSLILVLALTLTLSLSLCHSHCHCFRLRSGSGYDSVSAYLHHG